MELTQETITRLSLPFPTDLPAGNNIEYSPLFEQISLARDSDEMLFQDEEWACKVRQPDWLTVSTLCAQVLEIHSKDLQIACWLTQAQGKLLGPTGISCGLQLIKSLCDNLWPVLWPRQDEEGEDSNAIRLSRLDWLDNALIQIIKSFPLTEDGRLTMEQWERVQHFERHVAANASLRKVLEEDGYSGRNEYDDSIQRSSPLYIQAFLKQTEELQCTTLQLQNTIQVLCGDDVVVLRKSRNIVTEILELLMQLYPSLTAVDGEIDLSGSDSDDFPPESRKVETPDHQNREQIIGQIATIARYFRRYEPGSPVPYLLERAVRWANMDMNEWIEEILENNASAREEIMRVIKGSGN